MPTIVAVMTRFLTVAAAQMGPVQREHTRAQVVQRLIAMLLKQLTGQQAT